VHPRPRHAVRRARLEAKIRSITRNWSRPAFYLKLDLANFFVAIDKGRLQELLRSASRSRGCSGWPT
jgi:hypothetical protein